MSGFRIDIQGALRGLAEAEIRTRAAVGLYGDTAGKKLEREAKQNASWTDRTAHARGTITGGGEWQGNKMVVHVEGNTSYFPYLEFCNSKRYAILYPTIQRLSPEIIRGMERILG